MIKVNIKLLSEADYLPNLRSVCLNAKKFKLNIMFKIKSSELVGLLTI